MLHEYRDEIAELKQKDNYFNSLFVKHNSLDEEIIELEKALADQFKIETKKKEKLKLKDEIHSIILEYKKGS